MKNKEKSKKKLIYGKYPISVRFSDEEYIALESYAEMKGIKISTLVRQSSIAYLQNFAEHENLFKKIKTEDPQQLEQTIFDVLNRNNDAIDKSIKKMEEEILKKLETLDLLERKNVFLHYFHNREVPPEDYGKSEKSANKRTEVLLKNIR